MSQNRTVASEPQRSYSSLLLELNSLIAAGKGDDEGADHLRDRMDIFWNRMNSEQQQRVRWLTVDLDDLNSGAGTGAASSMSTGNQWRESFLLVWQSKRANKFDLALELLRLPSASLPHIGGIAFMKGRAWEAAGFPEAALPFFRFAQQVNPNHYSGIYADYLYKLGRRDESTKMAEYVLNTYPNEPTGLFLACYILFRSVEGISLNEAKLVLERVRIGLNRALIAFPKTNFWQKEIHAGITVILGAVLTKMERFSEAIRLYDNYLALNPSDAEFYSARGEAKLQARRDGAIEDFEKAISFRTRWGWAYASVARHQLERGEYSKALATCNKAIHMNSIEPIEARAALHEFRAIAQAILRQPKQRIEDDYRIARALVPNDDNIRHRQLKVESMTSDLLKNMVTGKYFRSFAPVSTRPASHVYLDTIAQALTSQGAALVESS